MGFETSVTSNYNQGRFSTEEEIRVSFPSIDYRMDSASHGGLNILTDGTRAVVDDSDNSTMVVGSSGSKKTRNVVMPFIYSCAMAGKSMVIHDPKGDIDRTMHKRLKKLGYRIIMLDYRNPEFGDRYNPLEYAAKIYQGGDTQRANEMFMSFSNTVFESMKSEKDPFWHLTAGAYHAGLASLLCDLVPAEEVTIDNIYNLHFQGDAKVGGSTYIKNYFEKNQDKRYWKLIYPVVMAPNDTKGSLHSIFSSCINSFVQNDTITDQTYNSTFQVQDLVKEKTAVFIISRDEGSVYNALIAAVIDQFYQILTEYAEKNGGCLERKVCFVLDEFGNLAKINAIERKISLSRARGITWLLVCQSLEQLSVVYGTKIAPIILGNCNNLVYLYSPDIALLKRISEMCGTREDELSRRMLPLCPVEMLRHLDKESGECLMLLDRMHPFITMLSDISEYYGVQPTYSLNVEKRVVQERNPIDFKGIVDKMREEVINKWLNENSNKETDRSQQKQVENHEDVNKVIGILEDPTPNISTKVVEAVINDIISELKKERKEE